MTQRPLYDAVTRTKAAIVSELSGQHSLSNLLKCAGLARSSYYYALSHPKRPTKAGALGSGGRDLLAHRQRLRTP
ncbi:MAG: hypothetical protein LIV22_04735, partial [Olegusella sp.]|nr:hypothetical protein [Olegusella sp.]